MDFRAGRKRNLIIMVCAVVAVAGLIAVTVFGVPARTLFLYGAFAACPLMHLFMGHGAHGHRSNEPHQPAEAPAPPTSDTL